MSHEHNSPKQEASTENTSALSESAFDGGETGQFMSAPLFQLKAGTADDPPVQRKGSSGGLGDDIVNGFAATSGHDLSDVNVHRNSSKPSEVGALAYAQGNDIHLGPGQDQHLPHEAAHIVQQREGRVKPTTEVNGMAVNDNQGLESEADRMGEQAMQMKSTGGAAQFKSAGLGMRNSMRGTMQAKMSPIQMQVDSHFGEWHDDKFELSKAGDFRQVEMNLRFKPKMTVDAELIGLTQTATSIRNGSPYNISGNQDRSISAKDAIEVDPTTKETDEGAHIDQSDQNRNPMYAVGEAPNADTNLGDTLPDPDVTQSNNSGRHGFRYNDPSGGSAEQDALLNDRPILAAASHDSGQIFETTAVAIKGNQEGTYYGSVQWGWRTDSAGDFTQIPFEVVSEGVPSSTFMESAEIWNNGTTRDGADTLDLPLVDVKVTTAPITQVLPPDFAGPALQIPAGTRVQVINAGAEGGIGVLRVVDGQYVDATIDVSAADMANLRDERA